jgi:aminoglycoside phosphotransferase
VNERLLLSADLAALVEGTAWEQVTLGESGALVYRLRDGTETRYLKVEPRRSHRDPHAEAERLRWLRNRLPVSALRSHRRAAELPAHLQRFPAQTPFNKRSP